MLVEYIGGQQVVLTGQLERKEKTRGKREKRKERKNKREEIEERLPRTWQDKEKGNNNKSFFLDCLLNKKITLEEKKTAFILNTFTLFLLP